MRIQTAALAALISTISWAAATSAHAATITTFGTTVSPGSSTISLNATTAPNNDNAVVQSSNLITATAFFNTLTPFDIEFVVADSGGTTEYAFNVIPLGYVNVNTVPWEGFRFELGFGTGADFVPVASGAGLVFDTPTMDPQPTSNVFTDLSHAPTRLTWTGGTVNPLIGGGGPPFSVLFSLSFDVPDGLSALHPQGLNRFTLRQTALTTVAEPASTALLGLSLTLLGLRRRFRD